MMVTMLAIIPLVAAPIFFVSRAKEKLNRTISPDVSCRGQVTINASSYDTREYEGRTRLFVRAEIVNRSSTDISDPAIRVLMIGQSGAVEDTFIKTVYDANIAPQKPYWLRVDGEMTVDPLQVKEVIAEVASADCKPAWE
jgi:hypothetical protein